MVIHFTFEAFSHHRTGVHNLFHRWCQKYFWKGSGGPQWGLGAVLPVGSPWSGVKAPEADDDLLIQQHNFCADSYVYAEIQL